jgi:hypothetical protein
MPWEIRKSYSIPGLGCDILLTISFVRYQFPIGHLRPNPSECSMHPEIF